MNGVVPTWVVPFATWTFQSVMSCSSAVLDAVGIGVVELGHVQRRRGRRAAAGSRATTTGGCGRDVVEQVPLADEVAELGPVTSSAELEAVDDSRLVVLALAVVLLPGREAGAVPLADVDVVDEELKDVVGGARNRLDEEPDGVNRSAVVVADAVFDEAAVRSSFVEIDVDAIGRVPKPDIGHPPAGAVVRAHADKQVGLLAVLRRDELERAVEHMVGVGLPSWVRC